MRLFSPPIRLHGCAPGFLASAPPLGAAAADGSQAQSEGAWTILQFAQERCEEFGWDRIGWHLLLAAALSVVLLWPLARMIAGPKRALGKTCLFIGSMIVLCAAFLALGYFILRAQSVSLLAGMGLVCLGIVFAQARHLFGASRGPAACILACSMAVAAVASYVGEFVTGPMPWTEFASKSGDERRQALAEWSAGKNPPASIPSHSSQPGQEPAAPLSASAAAPPDPAAETTTAAPAPPAPAKTGPDLQALYAQLQKARAALDVKDRVAVARFNEQAAAYQQEKALAAALSKPLSTKTAPSQSIPPENQAQIPRASKVTKK